MPDHELDLVELAVQNRLLTKKQADLIQEELQMYPGQKAGHLMLRRHYVTQEQLKELRDSVGRVDSGVETMAKSTHDSADSLDGIDMAGGNGGAKAAVAAPAIEPPVRQLQVPARPKPKMAPRVTALGKSSAAQQARQYPASIEQLLKMARHWGCSDLHLTVGRPPFIRLHGQIRYMEMEPLTPETVLYLILSSVTEQQWAEAEEKQQVDFSMEIPDLGRHRCNVFRTRLGWDAAYRIISNSLPTLEGLGLPPSLRTLTEFTQGLVMVTGPSGCGKTTTVAALLDLVNDNRRDHIITVEDPIEYIVPGKHCQVTQREVGRDTRSFAAALRAALREDPDIIFIGEMRDLETTSIAISAAETGHLVFGTMHTSSAARTVARIVDVYPIAQQTQILVMVAESLRGVVSQQLIPRRDGQGRVIALEVMINTSGIATQIKEGKTHLIGSAIQSGKKYGMMLMDDSIMYLYQNGFISGADAYQRANNKNQFESIKEA